MRLALIVTIQSASDVTLAQRLVAGRFLQPVPVFDQRVGVPTNDGDRGP